MATFRRNIKTIIRRPALSAVREALSIPTGQISLVEARLLGSLLGHLDGDRPIVEVGTLFGWSTRVMVLYKPVATPLLTIDNYCWNPLALSKQEHFSVTSEILEESKQHFNVTQLNQDKAEFYRTYAGPPPALIFLDADHSYEGTRADLEWATQYQDAIICLHDYRKEWPGVIEVVNELGGPEQIAGTLCTVKPGARFAG